MVGGGEYAWGEMRPKLTNECVGEEEKKRRLRKTVTVVKGDKVLAK